MVIICGDRNSSGCFEEMLSFELKRLPRHSVIIHGACKGVDLYAAHLATLLGYECKSYPADWDQFGPVAGPVRNRRMLEENKVDMVIAFHPDIFSSLGTKNMMELAYAKGIPVYIHDLKRKSKFEGNFEVL